MPTFAPLTAALGVTAMLATPAFAAVELGHSATFSIGAIVVDICQVSNVYRTYIAIPFRQLDARCTTLRPSGDAKPEPVTTVTRGESGAITALNIEF